MELIKFSMALICLLGNQCRETPANKILYVLPDSLTNTTCTYQPCTTLSKYVSDDGSLPDVANVEYHFLPGEHQVPANLILKNLYKFSIIGIVCKGSLQAVLVGCFHSQVLKIYTSHYVNIRNMTFKHCYSPQPYMYFTSLYLSWCFSCALENIIFTNFGIVSENLIGNSSLNRIYITHTGGQLCQGITLIYMNDGHLLTDKNEYHLLMNEIHITEISNGSKCFNFNDYYTAGIFVYVIRQAKNGTITISNSFFKAIHNTALCIRSNCGTITNIFSFNNCIFHSILAPNAPVVKAVLSNKNIIMSFNNCTFKHNHAEYALISIKLGGKLDVVCRSILDNQTVISLSSLFFRKGQFLSNRGQIWSLTTICNKTNISMIGPIIIKNNWSIALKRYKDLMIFHNMAVHIHGPMIISHNNVGRYTILSSTTSEVVFYDNIIIKQNLCEQVIFLKFQYAYIKIMEYTNITFINNKCSNKLIEVKKE